MRYRPLVKSGPRMEDARGGGDAEVDFATVCLEDCKDPEIGVEEEEKLYFKGADGTDKKEHEKGHYVKLKDSEKNRKLLELLDALEFNQVVIFVKSVQRCVTLAQLLIGQNFPAIAIHRGMNQEERLSRYQQFKDFQKRILVATNLFGRGVDIERVMATYRGSGIDYIEIRTDESDGVSAGADRRKEFNLHLGELIEECDDGEIEETAAAGRGGRDEAGVRQAARPLHRALQDAHRLHGADPDQRAARRD